MNVRLSKLAAVAGMLSLAACGGQTLDNGSSVVGPATGGTSAGGGGTGPGGAGSGNIAAAGYGAVDGGSGGRSAGGATNSGNTASAGGAHDSAAGASGSTGTSVGGRGAGGAANAASTGGTSGMNAASGGGSAAASAGFGGHAAAGASGSPDAGGTSSSSIPATWDTVKLVLSGTRPPCNGCHGNLGDGGFRITLTDDTQLYNRLTKTVVKDCGNNPIVTPGDPSKSALLEILQMDCSAKVPRMPPGCVPGDSGCVPPEYIAALTQWISDGAPEP